MARPNKTGLDYYSTETNRYSDQKIKRLVHAFSASGLAVYDYLLGIIYRDKGCFTVWDEGTVFDVADYFKMKETTVNEIITYCGVVGLFDKALLTNGKYITSRSIQERYVSICQTAKRKVINIPESIRLIQEETIVNSGRNGIDSGESTQRKEKESKVNNIPPTGEIVSLRPSTLIVTHFAMRHEIMAKNHGIPNEDLNSQLNAFDKHHVGKGTVFSNLDHLINSWGIWCSKYFSKKQSNTNNYNGSKKSEMAEKPKFNPAKDKYF